MKKTDFNLFQYCHDCIKPQENLDSEIFNYEYLMPKTIRQRFFNLVRIYMKNNVRIKEARIKDIILIGRKASYYYKKNNPYEILVILDLFNVPCLSHSINAHKKYLWMMKNFESSNFQFMLNNTPIILKSVVEIPYNCGVFSILQNKWLKNPEIDDALSAEKLWNDYFQINGDFNYFLKEMINTNINNNFTNHHRMLSYVDELEQLKASINGLLLYSLLKDSGSIEHMTTTISQAFTCSLSF